MKLPLKLCLGAGWEALDDSWLTVDLDPSAPVDVHCDVRALPPHWTGTFDEVRAVDILEHLSYRDTVPTLIEWARVLRSGGRMFIQVPAADRMMAMFLAPGAPWMGDVPSELEETPRIVKLAWRLLGGHYDGQYTRDSEHWYLNAHHALFDQETLHWAAEQAGLTVESIEVNPHPNYLVWMVKP